MDYISPNPLDKNARIAVIAPASSIEADETYAGLKVLQENGYRPVLGDNVFFMRTRGMYSASLKDRIEEFTWAFEDENIDAVMCATGGFGSAQLLPHLPYEMIAESRKPFIGFSDITALNNGLLAKCGLKTFNGPNLSICTDTKNDYNSCSETLLHSMKLLSMNERWGTKPFHRNDFLPRCISLGKKSSQVSGRAIGGNLFTLSTLLGTPYFPDPEGKILFLEDTRENGHYVANMLMHIRLSGMLDALNGIVIGRFTHQKEDLPAKSPP